MRGRGSIPWLRRPRIRARDAHLAATVKVSLETHDDLQLKDPTVDARLGVVVLGGRTPDERHRAVAGGVAASIRGVQSVLNLIVVDDSETGEA